MRFLDLLRLALRNCLRNGVKALLCAGAVCIGICSVCTVRGVGTATEGLISGELEQLGIGGMVLFSAEGPALDEEAVAAVASVEGVQAAMPLLCENGSAQLGSIRTDAAVCGVDEVLSRVFSLDVLHGRLPSRGEVAAAARVAVLDEQTALMVYKRENIVGKTVRLTVKDSTEAFTVIGVIRSQKQGLEALVGNLPCIVYVPNTALRELCGADGVRVLAVSAHADADRAQVARAAQRRLRQALHTEYACEQLDQYTDSFQRVTGAVSALISGVAAISILVGGLGVMNSMVAVVDERVGEIGVWMALGARRRSIAGCYLLEALLICLAGGLTGVAASCAVLKAVQAATGLTMELRPAELLLGVAGAALCGMLFGLIPALRAARMDPIDAIRSE